MILTIGVGCLGVIIGYVWGAHQAINRRILCCIVMPGRSCLEVAPKSVCKVIHEYAEIAKKGKR